MDTGGDNKKPGAGGILAASVLSLGLLLYIAHAIVETSRWARDLLLNGIDTLGLTEFAATTLFVGEMIMGGIAAMMSWALWRLYKRQVVESFRPVARAVVQAVGRDKRTYGTIGTWSLVVATPLVIALITYDVARSTDEVHLAARSLPTIETTPSNSSVSFDARWVFVGRSLEIGPTEFVKIAETAAPFAEKQAAENPCAMDDEFTSEQLSACVDDLKKHPPRTGWGGPRRWFVHRVNGRLVFDPVDGRAPLPRARPQLPLDLSAPAE